MTREERLDEQARIDNQNYDIAHGLYIEPEKIEQDDDEDDCNCSDPGCPCRGYKIGGV